MSNSLQRGFPSCRLKRSGWKSAGGKNAVDDRVKAGVPCDRFSLLGSNRTQDHPRELFGVSAISYKDSGGEATGRARAGWAEAGKTTGRSLQPIAPNKGEHHVRTLHGEGTARDLLRAV